MFRAGPLRPSEEQRLYAATSELTQMAGWLSIDASRHTDVRRYLTATLYAAHEIDDLPLAGHALGYMSVHAFYRGRHREALALAQTALDTITTAASPKTKASVRVRSARAHAALGHLDDCRKALDLAMEDFEQGDADEPLWSAYVDEIELAAQRGACFLDLQQPHLAQQALTEAIHLIETSASDRLRDLVHYKIRLARAHTQQGELEQAASVAEEAFTALDTQISSAPIRDRFTDLLTVIAPYNHVPAVRCLLERAGHLAH